MLRNMRAVFIKQLCAKCRRKKCGNPGRTNVSEECFAVFRKALEIEIGFDICSLLHILLSIQVPSKFKDLLVYFTSLLLIQQFRIIYHKIFSHFFYEYVGLSRSLGMFIRYVHFHFDKD